MRGIQVGGNKKFSTKLIDKSSFHSKLFIKVTIFNRIQANYALAITKDLQMIWSGSSCANKTNAAIAARASVRTMLVMMSAVSMGVVRAVTRACG